MSERTTKRADRFAKPRALLQLPLLRLLAINALAGMTAAAVAVAALIYSDPNGIGTLILNSTNPALPIALLFAGFTITLAAVAMGVAVMTLPYERDGGGDKGRGVGVEAECAFAPMMAPAYAKVGKKRG
ncbi:MAG: hypothetical protein KDJ16_09830 [Hyphomicrobiales bacterium]|nr:hypothetical protein [Hyphomicrobiales bacterium]